MALSLLDRLTDLDPDSKREAQSSRWEEMRQVKVSLCRDLTALLNTRRAEEDFPAGYEEATNSLLSFGVPDFTTHELKSDADRERVRRSLERAIRQFEPRLGRVSVSIEETDPLSPVLNFQIEAVLRTGPDAEPLVLDIAMRRESRRLRVSGGNS